MNKVFEYIRASKTAFGLSVTLFGGMVTTFIGGWQYVSEPGSSLNLFLVGAMAVVLAGATAIIRQEWLLIESERLFGNEAARALWLDGIPALPPYYLEYVRSGDYKTVNRFWEAGVIHAASPDGRSELYVACEAGLVPMVEQLLSRGSDPNASDAKGVTPLMLAARGGHLGIVRELLRYDCAVNAATYDEGTTALFIASAAGHADIVTDLLPLARVDQANHAHVSPMMAALVNQKWDVAEVLLPHVRPDQFDESGASLADYAIRAGADPVLTGKLMDRGSVQTNLVASGKPKVSDLGETSISWTRGDPTPAEAPRRWDHESFSVELTDHWFDGTCLDVTIHIRSAEPDGVLRKWGGSLKTATSEERLSFDRLPDTEDGIGPEGIEWSATGCLPGPLEGDPSQGLCLHLTAYSDSGPLRRFFIGPITPSPTWRWQPAGGVDED